ncbi:MAG: HEAT repeat domain-containing protein [Gemmatimonadales bacterium]
MFNQELYASAFARAVGLLRDRHAGRDQQKASLRALVALAELSAAALRLYDGILSVDDVAIASDVPFLPILVERLQAHRVAELMVGRQSEPREVLALLRGLASEPGAGPSIKERLRDVGSKRIMVILEQAGASTGGHSVTQAFDMVEIEAAAAAAPAAPQPPARPALEDDLLKEWETLTTGEVPQPGIEFRLDQDETEPPGEATAEEHAPDVPEPRPEPEPEPAWDAGATAQEATSLQATLSAVVLDPYGSAILDRLTALAEQVTVALREDDSDAALRALAIVIDLEPGAPQGPPRTSYDAVLKRTLTREVLAQVSHSLLTPSLMDAAGKVLQRAQAEGAELLLGLLVTAETRRERKAYMSVLRAIPEAKDRLIGMLGHDQWFVVRNVADLLGEQCVVEAVPALDRALRHADARVRLSAAVALAKIGTQATVEPLRRALGAGTPELRAQVAASIGGARSRPLVMPLLALAESEVNPEVVREYYRALGRIGSPEALQALANAAAPGGKLVGRKSAALRLAAVEGLRLAGAKGVLAGLAGDSDKAVREAARAPIKPR